MITCRTFVDFLMEYLDGSLPPGQADSFDEHLAQCTACVAYMKTYQETVRLGKQAFSDPDAEVPEDVPEELVKAILEARKRA
jgi:anti-sigma factor RsiW